mmetsp:Transcript_53194/g.105635  ORF Transcript_53194/g.105635 Transcript_53194/m.105635 type:complete len:89 (-) Transcript_53194:38-304(-)
MEIFQPAMVPGLDLDYRNVSTGQLVEMLPNGTVSKTQTNLKRQWLVAKEPEWEALTSLGRVPGRHSSCRIFARRSLLPQNFICEMLYQ